MASRREFIKGSIGVTGLALCCGSSLLLQGCTSLTYVNATLVGERLVVNKLDLVNNKYVLLNHPKLMAPLYLKDPGNDQYLAILLLCTHKGCDVKPAGGIFVCPCHGSEFNSNGEVLQGPAEERLAIYDTSSDHSYVYINLK